jgi:hypothetical protein
MLAVFFVDRMAEEFPTSIYQLEGHSSGFSQSYAGVYEMKRCCEHPNL